MTSPENSIDPEAAENPVTSAADAELIAAAEKKAKASARAAKAAATRARNAAARAEAAEAEAAAAESAPDTAADSATSAEAAAETAAVIDSVVAAEVAPAAPAASIAELAEASESAATAEPAELAESAVAAEPAASIAELAAASESAAVPEAPAQDALNEAFPAAETLHVADPEDVARASNTRRTFVVRVLVALFSVILIPLGFALIFQGGYGIYAMFANQVEVAPEASSILYILLGLIAVILPVIASAWSSLGMYIVGGLLTVFGIVGLFSFTFFWKTYEVLFTAGVAEAVTIMTILTLSTGLALTAGLIFIAVGVVSAITRARAIAAPVESFDEFDEAETAAEASQDEVRPAPALPAAGL